MAYCKPCRKNHVHDIVEIVYANTMKSYTHKGGDPDACATLLKSLSADIRFDLHNVLDHFDIKEPLDGVPKGVECCALSYVGNLTRTRISARCEIQMRIANNQINFGILVFKCGRRKGTEEENSFVAPGSKAWVNRLLPLATLEHGLFIDDSEDHAKSTQCLNLDYLDSVHTDATKEDAIKALYAFNKKYKLL